MDFAYPHLLYLLFAVPAIILLYAASRIIRKRNLAKFGKIENLQSLMPEASRYKPIIKLVLVLLALTSIIIALARPRYGEKQESDSRKGIEVVLAVDVSRSMLASSTDDANGISRLDRTKYLLTRMIDRLHDDRVGLIVFAGNAYTQLPVTNDFISAKMFVNDLSPDMVSTQGTDIGAAIGMAMRCFTPDKNINKAIVLITDSEDNEQGALQVARQAADADIQIDVVGVGSVKGNPIPINSQRSDFLRDETGNIVMTALNKQTAEEIAKAGNGIYINGADNDAPQKLTDQLDTLAKTDFGPGQYSSGAELFPWFIMIAMILLIADVFILDRKIGWLQKINFFTREQK